MKLYKTEEHQDFAKTLNNIAITYNSLGKIDKALEITQKVLSKV